MYIELGNLLFIDAPEEIMRMVAIVALFAIYGKVMVKIFGKEK